MQALVFSFMGSRLVGMVGAQTMHLYMPIKPQSTTGSSNNRDKGEFIYIFVCYIVIERLCRGSIYRIFLLYIYIYIYIYDICIIYIKYLTLFLI